MRYLLAAATTAAQISKTVPRLQRLLWAVWQLQITAPSSLLSHLAASEQLPDACIALQSRSPMQAQRRHSSGVLKQSNAPALEDVKDKAPKIASMRRAVRI
jgi:hypothetical protein